MTQSELQSQNPITDYPAPNAPSHHANTGSKGIMFALGTMLVLYFIIAIIGLIYGLGWGSLFLPIIVYHLLYGMAVAAMWAYRRLIIW